jgi:hypothetical protein
MSPLGESRRFGDVRATSALFLIADVRREDRLVRKVPMSDITVQKVATMANFTYRCPRALPVPLSMKCRRVQAVHFTAS